MEKACKCPIRPNMTYEELMEEIVYPAIYCTSSKVTGLDTGYICPTLDKELDRARKDRRMKKYSSQAAKQRKKEKAKKLMMEGAPREEIVNRLRSSTRKRRRKIHATYRACPLYG